MHHQFLENMKQLLVVVFFFVSVLAHGQSYVDSGIRHFASGDFDKALEAFEEADEIASMITESAKAKLYYYRGIIWLKKAEKSNGTSAELDPLFLSYTDLTRVLKSDNSWAPQVEEAYETLYPLIIKEADFYLKLEKKEEGLTGKLGHLDNRINYLAMAKELETSANPLLYLGQTNKQAGDLIFSNSSNVAELQKAKAYYERSVGYYEQARYEDPFSKEIIRDLLTLSERLADGERIEEYKKLLQLAGG